MLPSNYKFRVYNDAGVAVTVQADWRPYRWSLGSLVYSGNVTPIASGSVGIGTAVVSAAIDNTSGLSVGGHLTLYATPGSAPIGNAQLIVYLIGSNDNAVFEDMQIAVGEGLGTVVGIFPLAGTSLIHLQIEV